MGILKENFLQTLLYVFELNSFLHKASSHKTFPLTRQAFTFILTHQLHKTRANIPRETFTSFTNFSITESTNHFHHDIFHGIACNKLNATIKLSTSNNVKLILLNQNIKYQLMVKHLITRSHNWEQPMNEKFFLHFLLALCAAAALSCLVKWKGRNFFYRSPLQTSFATSLVK